jgi:hypothetical protein
MMSNDVRTETVKEQLIFLSCEWTLIFGWLLSLGLVWRQTLFYGIYVYIIMLMLTMCVAVVALTMTGVWLKRRPESQSLFVRWLLGIGWLFVASLVGYGIIYYFGGVFSP